MTSLVFSPTFWHLSPPPHNFLTPKSLSIYHQFFLKMWSLPLPPKNADVIYGRSLKLKEPVAFSDTIGPPCLPDQGDFGDSSSFGAGMECYLSGWGRVGHGENMPQDIYGQPYKLRQAMLPLVDDKSCQEIYMEGANFEIQPTMQCAGGLKRSFNPAIFSL